MNKNNIDKLLNKIDNLQDILNGLIEKRKLLLDENDNKIIRRIDEKIEDLSNDIENTDLNIKTLKNELIKKSNEIGIDIKKYKTKLCNFEYCKKHFCTYAHNDKELRQYFDETFNNLETKDNKNINNYITEDINKDDEKETSTNILISLNNYECNNNKIIVDDINIGKKENEKKNNIINLVNEFYNHFDDNIKYLKNHIDNENLEVGINIKIELNKIMSDILLFKNNICDIYI